MYKAFVAFLCVMLVSAAGTAFSAEGDLDTSFGSAGVVTFNQVIISGFNDAAQAVALQDDGKIVIAGTVSNGLNTDVLIIRLTANGRRDTSFGFDGIVTFDTGNDDSARGVAVQPDGNIVVVGKTSNGTDNDILVIRRNSNGLPDTTFGVGLSGAVTFDLGNNETANAVAVQTNGRIVIAGTASNGTNNDLLIMRLLINGPPDATFSAGGFLTIDRGGNDSGRAVAVQTNGQIVAAGASSNGSNADIIIVRVNVNGLPDVSFNFNGIVTIDQGGSDSANAVAVQPNGQIVAAGTSSNGSNTDIIVVRVNANGLPDISFNFNGIVTIDPGGNDSGNALVLQTNGKIVVAGSSSSATDQDCITVRLNPNGLLDTTFSADGIKFFQGTAGGDDRGNAVAMQPDGRIIVAGAASNSLNSDVFVLRYSGDGVLDTTFNADGIFTFSGKTNSADAADAGNAVALQGNGKIVVVGQTSNGANNDVLVLRYNTDGRQDAAFSSDGVVTFNGSANDDDAARAVAVQSLDGKIVVVGQTSNGANSDVLVLRYNTDGTLDTGFSGNGVATYNGKANSDDIGRAVAIQADGKIVVVGQTSNGINNNLLVLRYNSDGSLDSTFGTGGVVTFGGSGNETGRSVAIQPDGMIVAAGVSSNGTDSDVLLVRFDTNGSPDTTFGTGGVVTYDSGSNDAARAVALQPDGKLVVAGFRNNGTKNIALIMRFASDGGLDNTFSGDGIVRYNSGSAGDEIGNAVAVQADGKIVVAGITNGTDVLALRYREDGTLDPLFSADGAIRYNGTADGMDTGNALALQADGKIVVAGVSNNDALVLRYFGQNVNVIAPNGGEVLEAGQPSPIDIAWTAPPKAVFFTIQLSVDNGQTWGTLAENVTGSTYPWTAPKPFNNKRACLIRVTGYDTARVKVSSDRSDAPFTIEVIRLNQPNGGETFTAGDPVDIVWTTHATKRPVDAVQLYYTVNAGKSWLLITAGISGNPGTFSWIAPSVSEPKKKGKVKVVLKDIQGKTVGSDASDAFITFQ